MTEARRHLVIVGGGHAHVFVLKSLAMRPEPALRVTVVSPFPYATYSGMVPESESGVIPARNAFENPPTTLLPSVNARL